MSHQAAYSMNSTLPDVYAVLRSRFPALADKSDDYLEGWLDASLEPGSKPPAGPSPAWKYDDDGTLWTRFTSPEIAALATARALVTGIPALRGLA